MIHNDQDILWFLDVTQVNIVSFPIKRSVMIVGSCIINVYQEARTRVFTSPLLQMMRKIREFGIVGGSQRFVYSRLVSDMSSLCYIIHI